MDTASVAPRGRRRPLMCYTRKEERDLEREARKITESRLMDEDARHRQEEHARRRAIEEKKPLTEKVREVVGVR
jgi:protein subunit release factor B